MSKTKIIAISNQKGGVGKSTTTGNVAAGLHDKGFRVLCIDLDPQGNLSFNMNASNRPLTSLEVLSGTAPAIDAIVKTEKADIIPASPALASADALITDTGKEFKLKEALEAIIDQYDYIIIDTAPTLGTTTVNALTVATSVIIPAQAEVYSLQGIGQLSQTIKTVKRYCNRDLFIEGILITRFNDRTVLGRDFADKLEIAAKELNTKLYNTRIRENVAVKEAQLSQQDIFTYDKKCNAAVDYLSLIEELVTNGK